MIELMMLLFKMNLRTVSPFSDVVLPTLPRAAPRCPW
jgi:hypothetical protein